MAEKSRLTRRFPAIYKEDILKNSSRPSAESEHASSCGNASIGRDATIGIGPSRLGPSIGVQPSMAKFNPGQFLQEVRAEARKVTWPTRNETLVTTGIVFVMVIVASLFFLIADRIISWLVSLVLGFGQ